MTDFYYHINMVRPNMYYDTMSSEFEKGPYNIDDLYSLSYVNDKINLLVKPMKCGKHMFPDLFEEFWVPKGVKSGFYLRTWGRKYCTSICSVGSRKMAVVKETKWKDYTWRGSQEHGKWAMSIEKSKPITCVGDLNYMSSQEDRGGAFVCIEDLKLWNAFKRLILYTDCDLLGCSQVSLS